MTTNNSDTLRRQRDALLAACRRARHALWSDSDEVRAAALAALDVTIAECTPLDVGRAMPLSVPTRAEVAAWMR